MPSATLDVSYPTTAQTFASYIVSYIALANNISTVCSQMSV